MDGMAWAKEVSKPRDCNDRPNFVGALTIRPSFLMALHLEGCQCESVPSNALQMDIVGRDADRSLMCSVNITHNCMSPSAYSFFLGCF